MEEKVCEERWKWKCGLVDFVS